MKLQLKLIPVLLLLAGCPETSGANAPPIDRLYFPVGIAHVDVAGSTEGVLFVANANSNKRYATGSVVALQLDLLGLPELSVDAGAPSILRLTDLKMTETQSVQIASFASELAVQPISATEYRLYVPTRSEGMNAYQLAARIEGTTPVLSCVDATGQDCSGKGTSMTPKVFDGIDAGVQWPLTPFGVAAANRTCATTAECCATGDSCGRTCEAGRCLDANRLPFADVWVSYAPRSDASALLNGRALIGHVARLDSDDFTFKTENLIPIGPGGSNSVAVAGSWVYVTGRILNPAPNLLRLVNREGVVLSTALESLFRVSDSRSITVSSDGQRLFIVGRVPDTLLVATITNQNSVPTLNFVRGVPLCDAPNDAKVIPRAGRGDLVAVTCTASGTVVLYDDEVGDLVAQLPGVGAQPYSLAVDVRGNAARIFVSTYGDGRIAVIDVPSLDRPQAARIVATLGETEVCLTQGESSPGCRASKEGSQ
ncbi:MAG: hypothetical protein Q8N23_22300 [Archangium sp.]|nr:hypothetical protein [Archangium sp.]MDP3155422.1 hypothetical protein [Archangium sp.]MDP3573754.1 hypothetical protein [Archangium sp.]